AVYPGEHLSRGAINESRVVPSRCKCSMRIRINANADLGRVARIAELFMHCLQEIHQFVMTLPCPKSLVGFMVNLLVFLGIQLLMKVSDGGICQLSSLHQRGTAPPHQKNEDDRSHPDGPPPQYSLRSNCRIPRR